MSDLISILLQAQIDPQAVSKIHKQIEDISKNAKAIKINIDIDGSALQAIENINKSIAKSNASLVPKIDTSQLEKGVQSITQHFKNGEKEASSMTRTTVAGFEKTVEVLKKVDGIYSDISKKDVTHNYEKERKSIEAIADAREKSVARVRAENEKLEQAQTKAINKAIDDNYKLQQAEEQRFKNLEVNIDNFKRKMLGDGVFKGEMDIFSEKQKGKYNKNLFSNLETEIKNLSNVTPDATEKIKALQFQWNSLKQSAAESGNIMTRTIENMGKFLRYYLAGGLLVGFVRDIKKGVESVKELDVSLTELSKVSDLSGEQLKTFTDRAYKVGGQIARTGKEVIDATTEFKRAGYELEDAFELSQQALLLTNIGDGINDVKEASSSLIAILKGFKMEAGETAYVVDALNEVSNKFAIDTINLTEIMKRVSGTIAQTGTSYEELLGLSVGGFESLRNAEMVASGINMISQRLKGMEEDGKAVEGLIPKIQEAFDKYTKGAVSIIDKQNGGLNSTYEILSQLQKVYPKLSDEAKAYINEAVAGNRQNKVLVAIMENWENVEKATSSATNSLGSANIENEKYLNSIEGKSKKLASSIQVFFKNLIDSNWIKDFIDVLNLLTNTLDSLVNNPMSKFIIQVGLVSTAIALSRKGILLFGDSLTYTAVKMFALNVAEQGLLATTQALTATMTASPLFAIVAGTATILAIIKAVDLLTISLKEQKAIVETISSDIQSLQSEYDKLKSIENRTDEQNAYLNLLQQELNNKKELLKIETERAIQQEFFKRTGSRKEGYENLDSGSDNIKKLIDNLKKLEDQLSNSKTKEEFDNINEKILNIRLSLTDSLKAIKGYVEIVGEDAPQALVELSSAIESVVVNQTKLTNITENENEAIQTTIQSIEDLTKKFEDITSKIQTYNVFLSEINSKEGLSAKSKQDIITKYQELLPYIDNEKELRKQLISIIVEEEKAQIQAYTNMLMHSEDFFNAKVKGNKELVDRLNEFYNIDLNNYKSLAEAKSAIESKLLQNLSTKWSQFYDVQRGMLTYDFTELQRVNPEEANKVLEEVRRLNRAKGEFEKLSLDLSPINFKDINLSSVKEPKKDNRQFLETIDAEIRAIKLKNDSLLKIEKSLQEQLKIAKEIEGIDGLNEQYRITGELIEHNKIMLESFKKEQDLVHARANEIRKQNSKYDTTNWFDSQGEATVSYINLYNNATKKQQEEMDKIFNQIQKLKKAWMESATEVEKIVDANKQLVIEQDKLLDQQYELARTNWIKEQNAALKDRRDRLQALQQIEEAIVAIIRKRGEEEKKALDEAHKADMDSLEKRHQERKKKYADDLDEFKKYIQAKIDALEPQWEEEDYLEQLNKEREEANRLQREIDVLSLDDSLMARNKVIELRKQLADQNEKIAKRQQTRERDLLKKSLQDQLKNREQEAKDKETIADKSYENEKKRLEEDYRINKEFLDKKYSDEQVYAEARESIMRGTVEVAEGMFVDIYDAYKDFEDKFGRGMGILGDIIKKDFLDQLEKAQQAVRDLEYTSRARDDYDSDYQPKDGENGFKDPRPGKGGSSGGGSSGGSLSDMSKSDYYKYVQMKQLWEMSKVSGDKASEDYAISVNKELRNKYGITSDNYSYNQLKDIKWEDLKKLGFDNGGKIIGTGSTLVDFHGTKNKPEWIFNDKQLKDTIANITLSTIKAVTPQIPNIASMGNMGGNTYDITFAIQGNMDRSILPEVQRMITSTIERVEFQKVKDLNKIGQFRPIR